MINDGARLERDGKLATDGGYYRGSVVLVVRTAERCLR